MAKGSGGRFASPNNGPVKRNNSTSTSTSSFKVPGSKVPTRTNSSGRNTQNPVPGSRAGKKK